MTLNITKCCFLDCGAFRCGGTLFISNYRSFSVRATSVLKCWAQYNSFCDVGVHSFALGSSLVDDTLVVFCRCEDGIFHFNVPFNTTSAGTNVESLNLSANYVSNHRSALYAGYQTGLHVHFSLFSSNYRGTCFGLGSDVVNSNISCLLLFKNSCLRDSGHPECLLVGSTVTILNCIFQGNTFEGAFGRIWHSLTVSVCL
jgi:hypothetical protein